MADIVLANQLFNKTQDDLLKIDPSTLLRPRISHERAEELTNILLRSLAPRFQYIEANFKTEVIKMYKHLQENLSNDSLVFYASTIALEDSDANELAKLVPVVAKHDKYLITWFRAVFQNDEDVLKIIDGDISPGHSHLDSSEDVLKLCQIGQTHKAMITKSTPITEAELEQAEADATRLFQLLGKKKDSKNHNPKDLWYRAYTKWVTSYEKLRAVGLFISSHEPDAHKLFPAISVGTSNKKPASAETTNTIENPETPSTTENPQNG